MWTSSIHCCTMKNTNMLECLKKGKLINSTIDAHRDRATKNHACSSNYILYSVNNNQLIYFHNSKQLYIHAVVASYLVVGISRKSNYYFKYVLENMT